MKKLALAVRVITVAPFMALVMLLILFFRTPLIFGGLPMFLMSVLFLVVLPLLAYPLQPLIKPFKDKGRDGQRTLAMIFFVAGYFLGCVAAAVLGAPQDVWFIFLSYMLSGCLVALFNKVFHFKASGHACGVSGPFLLLVYFGQPIGYIGLPVLALVWLVSLYMKRHTTAQFIVGALLPFAALGILMLGSTIF
jgi:hypothetical protein